MPVSKHTDPYGQVVVERIEAQVLPTTETTIINGDVDIVSIVISNAGGQANPKFTLKDKQATARLFVFGANTPVPTGACVMFGPGPGKRATGGLTWVQDTANALEGSIEYLKA